MPVGRHKLTEREEKTEVVQEVEAVVPEDDQPIPAPTVEQMSKKARVEPQQTEEEEEVKERPKRRRATLAPWWGAHSK
mgnify:CR=1 FL=1